MAKSASVPSGCELGALIFYQEPRSLLPLWPSIRLTEEATPTSFVRTRPYGSRIIVLKLAPVLNVGQLRWAHPSDIVRFDPSSVSETTKRTTPGLNDAFAIAEEANRSDYDLDYWKIMLESSLDVDKVGRDHDDDGYDDEDDENMLLAIKMGIADASYKAPKSSKSSTQARTQHIDTHARNLMLHSYGSGLRLPICEPFQAPSSFWTPSTSPPGEPHTFHYPPSSKRAVTISPDGSDTDSPSISQKRRLNYGHTGSSQNNPLQKSYPVLGNQPNPKDFDSDESEYDFAAERPEKACDIQTRDSKITCVPRRPSSSARRQSASTSPTTPQMKGSVFSAPKGDIIEEDLDESDHFVQVYVGPEIDPATDSHVDVRRRRYKFQLMKQHVFHRPYFQDNLSARNYFTPVGDNTWELVHPKLGDIIPEDFELIAQYLSTGDYGCKNPDDEEQIKLFFVQSMAAWGTAEALDMDDMLDYIVDKVRATRPWWDLWNPMAFACTLYREEVALGAHDRLKPLLAEFIAESFHSYMKDTELSDVFLERLQQLPELERDVMLKRAALLESSKRHQ